MFVLMPLFLPHTYPATSCLTSLRASAIFTLVVWFMGPSRGYVALTPAFPRTDANQSSVLVDDAGRAQITDFCFATVGADLDSEPTTSHLHDHAVRWTAPEVLEGGKHSKRADVFSLAMLMIEVRHASPIACERFVH